jgi:hypothetical protein
VGGGGREAGVRVVKVQIPFSFPVSSYTLGLEDKFVTHIFENPVADIRNSETRY